MNINVCIFTDGSKDSCKFVSAVFDKHFISRWGYLTNQFNIYYKSFNVRVVTHFYVINHFICTTWIKCLSVKKDLPAIKKLKRYIQIELATSKCQIRQFLFNFLWRAIPSSNIVLKWNWHLLKEVCFSPNQFVHLFCQKSYYPMSLLTD